MSLYIIDVRVNDTVVATARVGNIGGPEEASEYIGSAWTAAWKRREVVDALVTIAVLACGCSLDQSNPCRSHHDD